MATVYETLKGVSAYPIPDNTLNEIASHRDIELAEIATEEVIKSIAYVLAKADLLMWLSLAPNVSQGGQNYSFSDSQRLAFRQRANALYGLNDQEEVKPVFGYKGSRL